ncbi:MAG: hypothetical protein H7A35_13770 [Planctomycetales bacterium]|nr:hypothetical protein [bacterium]UNM07908.1 MAG: hypothetical protein H7A35_13770 [Planctomycetales bacterium]
MLIRRIFHNCGLKFVSLLLAITLSIYVAYFSNNPVRYPIDLPLRVSGLPQELVVNTEDSRIPDTIKLDVRGPYRAITNAQKMKLHASIDLSEAQPGTRTLYRVQLPTLDDLTVMDHNPKSVTVMVEPRAEKTLNIDVERRGSVKEGYEISREDVIPSTIAVSGPASIVNRIARCVITPRIQDLADRDSQNIVVRFQDGEDQTIPTGSLQVTPEVVQYEIDVIPAGSLRVLEISPHIVGEVAEGFRLGVSKPVPLYVPVASDIVPEGVYYVRTDRIDVSGLTETQVFSGLKIQYPFELPENSNLPLTCDVSVEVRQVTDDERLIPIELVNRRDDMDYNISPERLVFKSVELAELSEEEIASKIRAWIDVGAMEPGQVKRIPQVDLPLTLQHVTLDRMVVTVSINRKDAE